MSTPDMLACGLLRAVVKNQQVSAAQALDLQQLAMQQGISPVRAAWQALSVNWRQAAHTVGDMHNAPVLDLTAFMPEPIRGLDEEVMRKLRALDVLPLSVRAGRLWLAMGDPGDLLRLQRAASISGMQVAAVSVAVDALMQVLSRDTTPSGDAAPPPVAETAASGPAAGTTDRAGLDRFLRKYVQQAIERGADTLHIEPHGTEYRLRIRPQRQYETLASVPRAVGQMLAEGLQSQSVLELALSSEHVVSFHVNTLDTPAGLRMMLRRVMPMPELPTLQALGFSQADSDALVAALDDAQTGMVLVSCASAALRMAALQALCHVLDRPQEHVVILTGAVMQGLPGCTQITLGEGDAAQTSTLLERVLQHEPSRLVIADLDNSADALAHRQLAQWARSGVGQLIAGVGTDHGWLDAPAVPTLLMQMDTIGRHHSWRRVLAGGRNA